ncbi:pcp [Lepeophtheirus salmonis]|uniref:Pcp n=1 Tax=Lepeophtheirus salmonis TaxID=72036 RepID=A0A7R8CVJ2_LEPSM|nr:pcp [Lepeophtheirus salmonis]CAF2911258.1 pcp [Lepeophtheirus salmonis]
MKTRVLKHFIFRTKSQELRLISNTLQCRFDFVSSVSSGSRTGTTRPIRAQPLLRDQNFKKTKAIVITGFGPFGVHRNNASWSAVQLLPNLWDKEGSDTNVELIVEEIPVAYRFVQECEFSSSAKGIVLEEVACNEGYQKGDIDNSVPNCNKCVINTENSILVTKFDTQKIVKELREKDWFDIEVSCSRNAGRYLCEFTFFKSLHCTKGNSLFIHVPPLSETFTDEKMAKTILTIAEGVIKQIKSENIIGSAVFLII